MAAVAPRIAWRDPPVWTAEQLRICDWPLLSAILLARGISTRDAADTFLRAARQPHSDPALLPDMERAVEAIQRAVRDDVPIGIFGDYDVDGLTATAMLTRVLRRMGASPVPVIPHRLNETYGLTTEAIDRFHNAGIHFLIIVDCGSSNRAELEHALELGISAVVIDHHTVRDVLPHEVPFVSPRRPENRFPGTELSAVGVAWQVVRRLVGDEDAEMYLPYVALGTIADVVELTGENRMLVTRGLSKLRRWTLPGMRALCAAARIEQPAIRSYDVGHLIAPRLNAAGRMESADLALELLLADDAATATPLALKLDHLNRSRQFETNRIVREADAMLDELGGAENFPAIVVAHEGWSIGIVGIVAGRLADRYHRPVVVIQRGEETSRGSARSRGPIDLVEALRGCADLLERFGGHRHAAGLTIRTEHIDTFRDALGAAVLDLTGGHVPERELVTDAEVDPAELSLDLVDLLGRLEPFGQGNEQPLLVARGLTARNPRTSADGRHLLFGVSGERGRVHGAVFFGAGNRLEELRGYRRLDLAFAPRRDTWEGNTRLKLHVSEFRESI